MTLRARLTVGLLTIAVILVVPLFVATRSLDSIHRETKALRESEFAASLILGRLRDAINDLRSAEMAVLFVKEERSRATMMERIRSVERLADSLDVYELGRSARDLRSAMNVVAVGAQAEYEAALAGRDRDAERLSEEQVVPAILRAEAAVRTSERALRERTRARVADAAEKAQRGSSAAMIGLALAAIVAGLVAIRLTRSVSQPVTELLRGMRRVADGDFNTKLAVLPSRTDEFGKLAESFDDMSRQLAELDRLKAEFVSVASHELKTPINVILGYAQLLREELYGPLTDKQRKVAGVLESQTKTLSKLVKQLLDVTRFEAGAGRLDVREVMVAEFLHQLEHSFRVLADQRGIRFHVSTHDSLPEIVHWDSDRMNEVLGNLLSNAFKFTDRGGEVELAVAPVEEAIQLEVRDTGAGIPPGQLPRIFEKFYQADNQPEAQVGTGLGLAISRQIVEAHGGSVNVESTPGVGTTFTIVLPQHSIGRRSPMPQHATADVA